MKIIFLFSILLCFLSPISPLYAQFSHTSWAKKISGQFDEVGFKVVTDLNGNVLVTGSFSSPSISFGNITLQSQGSSDFFIAKFDSAGNILWAKSAGGSNTDVGLNLTTDKSGNILVVGHFQSSVMNYGSGIFTNTSNSSTDLFVLKYDKDGNVIWGKSAEGDNYDYAHGIATDADCNIFIAGQFSSPSLIFSSTVLFGTATINNSGNNMGGTVSDLFLVKLDSTGNPDWLKSADGFQGDVAHDVCIDSMGNAYITGAFNSPTLTFQNTTLINQSSNNSDAFIAKYDTFGTLQWAKSAGGFGSQSGQSITTDSYGNVLVAGEFEYKITFDMLLLNSLGAKDVFTAKFDANGNAIWANSYGGTGEDIANDISIINDDEFVLIGSFESPTLTSSTFVNPLMNTGNSDVFVLQADSSGQLVGAESFGGPLSEFGNGIVSDQEGNIFITGEYASNTVPFNNTSLSNIGERDAFLVKFGNLLAGIEEKDHQEKLLLYPNPFTTVLTIRFHKHVNQGTLLIYSSLGQKVKEISEVTGAEIQLFDMQLENGLYRFDLWEENKIVARGKAISVE